MRPQVIDPHTRIDAGGSALQAAKQHVARWVSHIGARLLSPNGLQAPDVRAALWRRGIAAQPKGFYASPVDPHDLTERSAPTDYPGLNLQAARQRQYLTTIFPIYRDEWATLHVRRPDDWTDRPRFYLRNDAFQNIDPLVYWAMIRHHRPARVVEIGSGFSTLLAAQAVRLNGMGTVTAIDPYPRTFLRRNDLGIELITQRAETAGAVRLLALEANDIVFVDSSHVVRQGGDVTWFFLEMLPRLRDGVLVHVHDIHLPFDYPVDIVRERNVYWTEQYLLQAYLIKNTHDEVLFASRYAVHSFPDEVSAAFPSVERLDGGSFWMRVMGNE